MDRSNTGILAALARGRTLRVSSVDRRLRRLAARVPGLAFGLALAVKPAGLAEVARVKGAPQARPAQRDAKHR